MKNGHLFSCIEHTSLWGALHNGGVVVGRSCVPQFIQVHGVVSTGLYNYTAVGMLAVGSEQSPRMEDVAGGGCMWSHMLQ